MHVVTVGAARPWSAPEVRHRPLDRRAVAAALVAAVLASLLAVVPGSRWAPSAPSASSAPGAATTDLHPAALTKAALERSYELTSLESTGFTDLPHALRAQNEASGYTAYLADGTTRVVVDGSTTGPLDVRLVGAGAPGAPAPLAPAEIASSGPLAWFRRAGLTEWFRNTPAGLEQGFTATSRPAGDALAVELAVPPATSPTIAPDGRSVVFSGAGGPVEYGDLSAVDGKGTTIPTHFELPEPGVVRIVADIADAAFPVTIDPTYTVHDRLDPVAHPYMTEMGTSLSAAAEFFAAGSPGDRTTGVAGGSVTITVYDDTPGFVGQPKTGLLTYALPGTAPRLGTSVAAFEDGQDIGSVVVAGAPGATVGALANAGTVVTFTGVMGTALGSSPGVVVLQSPTPHVGDDFGRSVGLSRDGLVLVVGAPLTDSGGVGNSGAAYVFTRASTQQQDFQYRQTLTAPTPQAGAYFGQSVAVDGGNLLVGAPGEDVSSLTNAGQLYRSTGSGGSWNTPTAIGVMSPVADQTVGSAVAIVGQRVFVGASGLSPQSDGRTPVVAGQVAFLDLGSSAGPLEAPNRLNLLPSNLDPSTAGNGFGASVALSADGVQGVVGEPGYQALSPAVSRGAVESVTYGGVGTFSTATGQTAMGAGSSTRLGAGVAVRGGATPEIYAGAPSEAIDATTVAAGSVSRYGRQGGAATTLTAPSKLFPRATSVNDRFGTAVAQSDASGATVAISMPGDAINSYGFGTVGIFHRDATGNLVRTALLSPKDDGSGISADAAFGTSLAFDGVELFVGVPNDNVKHAGNASRPPIGNGSVFHYRIAANGTATFVEVIQAPAAQWGQGAAFGASIAYRGSRLVIGAPGTGAGAAMPNGRAYLFVAPQTAPDAVVPGTVYSGAGAADHLGAAVGTDGTQVALAHLGGHSVDIWDGGIIANVALPGSAPAAMSLAMAPGLVVVGVGERDTAYTIQASSGTWPAAVSQTLVGTSGTGFGTSVSADDENGSSYAFLVSAPNESLPNASMNTGAVHLYGIDRAVSATQFTDRGVMQPLPTSGEAQAGMRYGAAVDLRGDNAQIGAPAYVQAAAHGFFDPQNATTDLNAGTAFHAFTQRRVPVTVPGATSSFGKSVAIRSDTLVVGEPGRERAHVFQRDLTDRWSLVATLIAPDGVSGDQFGRAVAISNDPSGEQVVAVGAPGSNEGVGAVYLFHSGEGDWPYLQRLSFGSPPSTGGWANGLGTSLALSPHHLLVGAPTCCGNGFTDGGGAVLAYDRSASTIDFSYAATLTKAYDSWDPYPNAGSSVAVAENSAGDAIGAFGAPGGVNLDGSVSFVQYDHTSHTWGGAITTTAPQGSFEQLGTSVSLADRLDGVFVGYVGAPGTSGGAGAIREYRSDLGWNAPAYAWQGSSPSERSFGDSVAVEVVHDPAGGPTAIYDSYVVSSSMVTSPSSGPAALYRFPQLEPSSCVGNPCAGDADDAQGLHSVGDGLVWEPTIALDGQREAIGSAGGGVLVLEPLSYAPAPLDPNPASLSLALSADTPSVPSGVSALPVGDLPPAAVARSGNTGSGAGTGGIAGTPVKTIDFGAPLSATLASSPVKTIPVKTIPVKTIAAGAEALKQVRLAQAPTSYPGGWAKLLADSGWTAPWSLETTTLYDVWDVVGDRLTLGQIDLSATPVKTITLAGIALGATPVKTIPIGSNANPLVDWCNAIQALGYDCQTVLHFDPSHPDQTAASDDVTLASLSLQGVPIKTIPIADVPVKTINLDASPVKTIPIDSIDLSASPVKTIPVKTIDFNSPLAAPVKTIPVKTIPVKTIPVKTIDLHSITIDGTPIDQITLDHVDMRNPASTPVKTIPVKTIVLGSSPVKTIPVKTIPIDSIPVKTIDLSSITINGTPVKTILLGAIDIDSTPVKTIPVKTIDLATSPVKTIPVKTIPVKTIPVKTIDLQAMTLSGVPVKTIPVKTIDIANTPVKTILLRSLADPNAVVDCSKIACLSTDRTLGDAARAGIIRDGATLGDILSALSGIRLGDIAGAFSGVTRQQVESAYQQWAEGKTLGDLTDLDTLTLGDLPHDQAGFTSTTLGDIVGAMSGIRLGQIADALAGYSRDQVDAAYKAWAGTKTLADLADLDTMTLGDLPTDQPGYATTTLGAIQSLLGSVRLGDLAGVAGWNENELQAGVNRLSTTVGDLAGAGGLGSLTLGDIAQLTGLTIGDLIKVVLPDSHALDGITLGDVLITLIARSQYPWETVQLDDSTLRSLDTTSRAVTFTAGISVGHTLGLHDVELHVALPPGSTYVPGSFDAGGLPADVHSTGSDVIDATLHDVAGGSQPQVTFQARPPTDVGPATTDATATVADIGLTASASKTVDVTDSFEPNDTPAQATPLPQGSILLSHVASASDVDVFKLDVTQVGQRLSLSLSNLDADLDLLLYGPRSDSTVTVTGRSKDAYDTSDGTQHQTGDVALTGLPLLRQSRNVGTTDEQIDTLALGTTGTYYVEVVGHNGAVDHQPYALRAKVIDAPAPPPCQARTVPTASAPAPAVTSIPADTNALFLVNASRLAGLYPGSGPGTGADLLQQLGSFDGSAQGIKAAVIPVDAYSDVATAYAGWDAASCSPAKANAVVDAIIGHVAQLRSQAPGIRYIVPIGSDDVIPFYRAPDHTDVANEAGYAETFETTLADAAGNPVYNNAAYGTFANHTVQTDNPYGTLSPTPLSDRFLFVPDAAVGRLVETPAEIGRQLRDFTASNGRLAVHTALVAGYDFLADGSRKESDGLGHTLPGATDSSLINELWSANDLDAKLLPTSAAGSAPDLAAVNAHFNHFELLPADQNLLDQEDHLYTTADLLAKAPRGLQGSILFTMGCHAGLSASNLMIAQAGGDPVLGSDWAETVSAEGGTLVGNTGFGYGDTDTVAYSEQLMQLFAQRLDGSLPAGVAFTLAKQQYAADLAEVGVFDEKVLMEATYYGLPFYNLDVPTPPTVPARPPAITKAPSSVTGLDAGTVAIDPVFDRVDTASGHGSYWSARSATGDPQVTALQDAPIQPRVTATITQPAVGSPAELGAVSHGALVTRLTSHDVFGVDPVISQPTFDSSVGQVEPTFTGGAFPDSALTVNDYYSRYGAEQQLTVTAGQYRSDHGGVQRLYDHLQATVYYAPPGNTDFTPPAVRQVQMSQVGGGTSFTVTADDPGEGTVTNVRRVVVLAAVPDLYGGSTTWQAVDLVNTPGTDTWTGSIPGLTGAVEAIVQALDAAGNVAVGSDKAVGFVAEGTAPPTNGDLHLSVPAPSGQGGWSTGPVTVTASDAGSSISYSVDGGAITPYTAPFTVSGDGVHQVVVTTADGQRAQTTISIDGTAPNDAVTAPTAGQTIGHATGTRLAAGCTDAGSGVAGGGCPIVLDAGTPSSQAVTDGFDLSALPSGQHTLTTGPSRDVAGNASAPRTVSFTVVTLMASATAPPDGTNAWYKRYPHVTATDGGYTHMTGGTDYAPPQPYVAGNELVVDRDGEHDVTFADDLGQSARVHVKVDHSAPTGSVTGPAPDGVVLGANTSAVLGFTCADATSGMASCTAAIDGTGWTAGAVVPRTAGTHTIVVTATDLAGNTSTTSSTYRIAPPPVVSGESVTGLTSLPVGQAKVTALFASLPAAGPFTVTVAWGDGTSTTCTSATAATATCGVTAPAGTASGSVTATHKYTTIGLLRTITVTVTDRFGQSGTQSKQQLL